MTLTHPFYISSRLMAALNVGGADIALSLLGRERDGRDRYQWQIDLPDGREFHGSDLRTGCQGTESFQEVFKTLLDFLAASAESYPDGENADLFPTAVVEWAYQYSDEISMMALELAETPGLIGD